MLLTRYGWLGVLALFGGCQGCKSCQPDLPQETDETEDTGDTGEEDTGDTGVEPPCDVPEVEPNNTASQATALPMEKEGCGDFASEVDLDHWRFTLEREAWLQVRVDARSLGSFAHPSIVIDGDQTGESAAVGYVGTEDARLLFPALPDTYTTALLDGGGGGGPEHFYEIVASESKEPVSWEKEEAGENDDIDGAQEVLGGDVVFGFIEADYDQDWYQVDVPVGKHTLILDIDAWEHGSAARTKILVYRGESADDAEWLDGFYLGQEGWEPDPWGEVSSAGDETLWFQVQDDRDQSGRTCWYVLEVELEAS